MLNSCFVSASSPGALESAGAVGCVPAMKVRWACILLLALTVSPGPARRVRAEVIRAEEERLIGWLGEVPRPNSGGADARDRAAEIVTTDERGVRYDASTLDTDHIGVGNPNHLLHFVVRAEVNEALLQVILWRGRIQPRDVHRPVHKP